MKLVTKCAFKHLQILLVWFGRPILETFAMVKFKNKFFWNTLLDSVPAKELNKVAIEVAAIMKYIFFSRYPNITFLLII